MPPGNTQGLTRELKEKFERYVMSTYGRLPLAVERGEGSWVWDHAGKRYLDFTSGIAVNSLGHCHPALTRAITEQAARLAHCSNLFYIEGQVALAEALVRVSFADKAFFCNTGTEANEAALKLSRKWGRAHGGRFKVVSAKGSFHGRTFGSLSATGKPRLRRGFAPMLPGMKFVPYGDVRSLAAALADPKICAFIVEPIQGENGVVLPPDGYLEAARALCTEHGTLLVLDEVQTGLGRTGRMFAYEHAGIEPDVMTLAKSLGGGLPVGAVLARDDVAIHFTPGSHGTTMGGNPLAMHTAGVFLDVIARDGLIDNSERMGKVLLDGLERLAGKHPKLVKEARGRGLITALELSSDAVGEAALAGSIERGFLFILTVGRVARLLPPLNVTRDEVELAIETLDQTLEGLEDG